MSDIYLDHAATTPLREEVLQAMLPFLTKNYANPSSIYRMAQSARAAVDVARDMVARGLSARPSEIVFTSGGTESNNAAIKGAALARRPHTHLVTTTIEHHAVLHPVEEMCRLFGFSSTIIPVGRDGIVDPNEIEGALQSDTALVSVMWANNEIGTIQPIAEIAAITRAADVPLHVDAVQAAGSLPIDLQTVPVDLLSISAHKFYGPKGVGALFVRQGTPWWPLLTGGGQERNRRAGTENVAGIVGMARALELALADRESAVAHVRTLRDFLLETLTRSISGLHLNGDLERRLANNLNVSIEGVHGESLLVALDLAQIMASSGSACTSGSLEPSHVLTAIGLSEALASSSLRLTLGPENSMDEMRRTADVVTAVVDRLRRVAPVGRQS